MKRARVLVLGGTKFVGLELVKRMVESEKYEITVASRRQVDFIRNNIAIDRKNQDQLEQLFKSQSFDVVIDFISFSYPDARKLLRAMEMSQTKKPYLIVVSSTYVYGNPAELTLSKTYQEEAFEPLTYEYSTLDRPEADYFIGKRSMESFIVRNYDNYVLVRYPIILGLNDYTGRTTYFSTLIKERKAIQLDSKSGVSNFIFVKEAADLLMYLLESRLKGIYNCSFDECLNEFDLLSLYAEFYKVDLAEIVSTQGQLIKTPFYYRKDFIIDNTKVKKVFTLNATFKESLYRELLLINRHNF